MLFGMMEPAPKQVLLASSRMLLGVGPVFLPSTYSELFPSVTVLLIFSHRFVIFAGLSMLCLGFVLTCIQLV